jgi:bacterial/archaeal transporter family-2 protein
MMELLAALSGAGVVVGRMLNAQAGSRIGLGRSTFNNYWVGLVVCLIAMLLAGGRLAPLKQSANIFMYLGGVLGVGIVMLSSLVALRISTLRLTLVAFVSQMATALALDAFLSGSLSVYRAIGSLLVLLGLLVIRLDGDPSARAKRD